MLFLHVSLSPLESPACEVLTDVAVSSDTTQTAASCGNVRHRGFQASPLLQHTFFQSCQAWYCVLFVVFALHHAHTATL